MSRPVFLFWLSRRRTISSSFALLFVVMFAVALPQRSAFSAVSVPHPDRVNPLLAPCTIYDSLYYKQLPFRSDNFEDWPQEYHSAVQRIVDEHFDFMQRTVNCSAGSSEDLLQAQSQLSGLARRLPTWQSNRGRTPPLRQTDIGAVLMEFLNVYECAMQERYFFLTYDAWETVRKKKEEDENGVNATRGRYVSYSLVLGEMWKEGSSIEFEIRLSRDLLNRVLALVAGSSRLLALDAELQCIEGASMDLRNAAALSAEAATCLPRIWNAKDPLRDFN